MELNEIVLGSTTRGPQECKVCTYVQNFSGYKAKHCVTWHKNITVETVSNAPTSNEYRNEIETGSLKISAFIYLVASGMI